MIATQDSKEQLHGNMEGPPKLHHNPFRIFVIVFTIFFLIIVLAFNGLSSGGGTIGDRMGPNAGLFLSTITNQSNKYYLSFTPAGWTFSIWGFIYTFQVLFMILLVVAIFRKGSEGYLYLTPSVFPVVLFITYNLANGCNVAWIFTFDRDLLEAALCCLIAISICCYATVGISIWALHRHREEMQECKNCWMKAGIRIFLQNGVGMYGAWCTCATLLNLGMVLVYSHGTGVEEPTACTIILSILLVEVLLFSVADIVFLDRFMRHLITPYITFIVALIGSLTNQKDELDAEDLKIGRIPRTTINRNLTVGVLAVACVVFAIKIVITIWRDKKERKLRAEA